MEITVSNYQEFKQNVDREMKAAAQSFVRIGYLLRQAKDNPNIMFGSGYENVNEFAKAEYGLDHTQVSRFIRINERFSEGGNSDRLQEKYENMGSAKLTLMLSLPDTITEELTPDYTKSEIQAIKEEIEAEAKVTDIERMIEGEETETTPIQQIMREVCHNNPKLYCKLHKAAVEELKEIMAPNGEATYSARLRGVGRVMLFAKDEPQIVYVREDTKERITWEGIWLAIPTAKANNPKESWSLIYGEPFPEDVPEQKTKVQKAEAPKTVKEDLTTKENANSTPTDTDSEPKTEKVEENTQNEPPKMSENVDFPPTGGDFMNEPEKEEKSEVKNPENVDFPEGETTFKTGDETDAYNDADTDGIADEQIEGQTSIEDHEEWMPELSINDRKRIIGQHEDLKDSVKELDQKIGNMDNRGAIEVLKDIEWLARNIRQTIEEALRE